MLFKNNHFLYSGIEQGSKQMEKEFEAIRIGENAKRCQVLGVVLVILNILLIVIDLSVYKVMQYKTSAYFYLHISHLFIFFILLIWLVVFKFIKNHANFFYIKILNTSFLSIVIAWCTFMGINSTKITGGITAYIICMFCFAACFFIKPFKAFLFYLVSETIFIVGLFLAIENTQILYSHLVNLIITFLLIQITSTLNYTYFHRDFINKKNILKSKKELEEAHLKLKEYDKLRTDFFVNISHEFRTPLNVIYSAEQMIECVLKSENQNDIRFYKYNEMIRKNTYRLLRLINNLIDITKIEASGFELRFNNVDIIKLTEDVTIAVAKHIENKGVSLTFDTEAEEKIIACDPQSIEKILLNLLSNAVKYGKNKGAILVNVFLEQGYVCIAVRDRGIGIAADMQDSIFKRFIQVDKSLKRKREGSGIGLFLVKQLVEMHGGNISVISKLGEGSEFVVKLPDITISDYKEACDLPPLKEKCMDKISIEFSDIYQ
ncbi:MAG: ATPase, histidine kinase, gyrase and HSP90-like domain protein [Clostridia bacterium]|jgi:signal transduction histidine kinase|nr:ATPase, histidine kinase, gyrase and HSP90-like domain protein [Clostridia bacterium]